MHRTAMILAGLLALALADESMPAQPELRLGSGAQLYTWESAWPLAPDHERLGPTHAGVVFDKSGRIYVGTNSPRAVLVFDEEGNLLLTIGEQHARGIHGMLMVERDGQEQLLLTQLRTQEVIALSLNGELLWRLGIPDAEGLYGEERKFHPTSVAMAPDGRLFVADGYGRSWVHLYDANRNYLRSIGGLGTDLGKFNIPHGLLVDTREEPATLLVADRANHRIQRFSLEGELIGKLDVELRRPCSISSREKNLVIADLDGRVTILDQNDQLVLHLGDNPDTDQRGQFKIPTSDWKNGTFLSPHHAAWDATGNLFVLDWNLYGRVTKLTRVNE